MRDIPSSHDSSDAAKLKNAEILGKYYSLFDGAFGNESRWLLSDLPKDLWRFLESLDADGITQKEQRVIAKQI